MYSRVHCWEGNTRKEQIKCLFSDSWALSQYLYIVALSAANNMLANIHFFLHLFFDQVEIIHGMHTCVILTFSHGGVIHRGEGGRRGVSLFGALLLPAFLAPLTFLHPVPSSTEQHWLNAPCSPFSPCWISAAWLCRYDSAALWQPQTEVPSLDLTAVQIAATSQSCWPASAANKLITPVSYRFWSWFHQNYNYGEKLASVSAILVSFVSFKAEPSILIWRLPFLTSSGGFTFTDARK